MVYKEAPRDVIGSTLVELGEKDKKIIVLDADFNNCSKTEAFKDRFPDRFVQVGIAEQNLIGVAAGISAIGFTAFAATIAAFITRRAYDQIFQSVALSGLNVKILGLYSGLFVGKNGASHQSLEDLAIMRTIPTMRVLQPADAVEMRQMLRFAAENYGPVYIRAARDPIPIFVPDNYVFKLGKALTLRPGKDITIITCGEPIGDSLEAAEILAKEGIDCRVINMSSIKPIDKEAIINAARETGTIVTVENHNILGGLGSAVAEVVTEHAPVHVKRIGVKDVFGKSGTDDEMKKEFGLTIQDIASAVRRAVKTKK